MKTKLLCILSLAVTLCSCDTKQTLEDIRYSFFIFIYKDETSKDLIVTTLASPETPSGVYNFPKRYRNEPYFGRERWSENPEKYRYDICELATEDKLLALSGGYYTLFPYTNIHHTEQDVLRDGKWADICSVNPLELPVISSAYSLYSDIRYFEIRSLEKITGKSRKEMTIDDIETAINKVIDEDKLDKYSRKVSNMWFSGE